MENTEDVLENLNIINHLSDNSNKRSKINYLEKNFSKYRYPKDLHCILLIAIGYSFYKNEENDSEIEDINFLKFILNNLLLSNYLELGMVCFYIITKRYVNYEEKYKRFNNISLRRLINTLKKNKSRELYQIIINGVINNDEITKLSLDFFHRFYEIIGDNHPPSLSDFTMKDIFYMVFKANQDEDVELLKSFEKDSLAFLDNNLDNIFIEDNVFAVFCHCYVNIYNETDEIYRKLDNLLDEFLQKEKNVVKIILFLENFTQRDVNHPFYPKHYKNCLSIIESLLNLSHYDLIGEILFSFSFYNLDDIDYLRELREQLKFPSQANTPSIFKKGFNELSNFIDNYSNSSIEIQEEEESKKKEKFIRENNRIIKKLAKNFSSFQYSEEDLKMDVDKIVHWLNQFNNIKEMAIGLKLLQKINFYDRPTLVNAFNHLLKKLLEKESKEIIISNYGSPFNSNSFINYIIGDKAMPSGIDAKPLRAILDTKNYKNIEILFVEDTIGSGKQTSKILENLIGINETKLAENQEEKLIKQQIKIFRKFKLNFFFIVGLSEGIEYFRKKLEKNGFNAEIMCFQPESESIGAFHNAKKQYFDSKEEREFAKALCHNIGYQLLKDERWPEEKRLKRSLGYGDSQKLIVFSHNVPTYTLPILWKKGIYNGKKWEPLFLRRKKELKNGVVKSK